MVVKNPATRAARLRMGTHARTWEGEATQYCSKTTQRQDQSEVGICPFQTRSRASESWGLLR
eukprot:5135272-Alexandrium_andersonii.AAC.1